MHAGPHHAGREATAFFIGPDHHFHRAAGLDVVLVEAAQDLKPGHHPEAAIELAAGRLGVDVAAGHHRRRVRVGAGATREDVADGIDTDRAALGLAPLNEEVARLAVQLGQCLAVDAALGRGAQLGQGHQ